MYLSYEEHLRPQRADGRYVSVFAAQMAMMRDKKQELSLPEKMTHDEFILWQKKIKDKTRELLCIPEKTHQPAPVMLSCVQRDGYRVEKWELYPDDYTAVPFLALVPDIASKDNPVPSVICLPGTNHTKELLADEPRPEHPNRTSGRLFDRNRMAYHYVKAGFAAFAFDNPGFGETSVMTDAKYGETQLKFTFNCFSDRAIVLGQNYHGISTFHKLCFMDHLFTLDYVDKNKTAISGHSLGAQTAAFVALLCDDIKAVVYNDFICNELSRAIAVTENSKEDIFHCLAGGRMIPGIVSLFDNPEMCAALAPRYLALNEGGTQVDLDTVIRGYEICGAKDKLQISYYPRFADPSTRTRHDSIPKYGLSFDDYYFEYAHVDPADHSFRAEPSVRILMKCFFGEDK